MSRLPTQSDFERSAIPIFGPGIKDHETPPPPKLDIIPPSAGAPVNVLILLHGLGDTKAPFAQLGTPSPLPWAQ